MIHVMAHITVSVEYGMHSLLWLVGESDRPRSGRDLAAFQGIPPSYLLKVLAKLEKAGIVRAFEGARGGFRLGRPPEEITLLDVVDAIEGRKPLFDCQEVRGRCALFQPERPAWADHGVCSIHAAMLQAEKAMRSSLAAQTLAQISASVATKAPDTFSASVSDWFENRKAQPAQRAGEGT
ncbi:BadM/Rrf2 family transcriptional regulator [Novosphingobium sp. PhB55]|nr:BadM/Rrf2 family transcriptional regulator [Novosphingobium sp. PhB55]